MIFAISIWGAVLIMIYRLFSERQFFQGCYQMLRTPTVDIDNDKERKEK